MSEPKSKIEKAKVLSVTTKGTYTSKKTNKEEPINEIIIQDEANQGVVITGLKFGELPEKVKQGESVENVWVYEETKDGKVTTTFFFPESKGGGQGASGGRRFGASPEELKIKRMEAIGRFVGVGYSYSFDRAKGNPEATLEEVCKDGNLISERMLEQAIKMLGGG